MITSKMTIVAPRMPPDIAAASDGDDCVHGNGDCVHSNGDGVHDKLISVVNSVMLFAVGSMVKQVLGLYLS